MPRPKRSIQSEIKIDGFSLAWNLHREQQWCDEDQWKGVAIHVRVTGVARRELFLEYPAVRTQKDGWSRVDPLRPSIQKSGLNLTSVKPSRRVGIRTRAVNHSFIRFLSYRDKQSTYGWTRIHGEEELG